MFTEENAKEMQAKSVESRKENFKEKQTAREITKTLLLGEYQINDTERAMLDKLGYVGDNTAMAMLIVAMYKQAMSGSVKAFEMLMGLLGENPAKKVEITNNGFVDALNDIAKDVCTEEVVNNADS